MPTGSAEPGRWRRSRVPYVDAINKAYEDPFINEIVVVMASQSSKTETLLNLVGKTITDGPPVPLLYVGPTEVYVRSFSNDRLRALIESTPELFERLETGHRDKVTEKFFAGIRFGLAWAGSATMLSAHPVGRLFFDELDRMDGDVGNEGDPYIVGKARGETFTDFKSVAVTSPTIAEIARSWQLFRDGTMQRWAWPCSGCGVFFVVCLERLRWPEGATPEIALDESWIECPECKHKMFDDYRLKGNESGMYIPHDIDDEGQFVPRAEVAKKRTASFWVSGLCSPFRSIGDRAAEYIKAARTKSPSIIQSVLNTRFGEWYVAIGDAVESSELERLIGSYERETWPADAVFATGGIDVQKDGFYYVVRGWGAESESWLIDEGFVAGATEFDNVWIVLQRIIDQQIAGRAVKRWIIDAGYRPGDKYRTPIHKVKEFCRRNNGKVSPSYGRDQLADNATIKASRMTIEQGRVQIKTPVMSYVFNTDHFKQWLFSRYRLDDDHPGKFWLHADADPGYIKQISSEKLIITPNKKRVWIVKSGHENHYLDCEVMARLAAVLEGADKLISKPKTQTDSHEGQAPRNAPPKKRGRRSSRLAGYNEH